LSNGWPPREVRFVLFGEDARRPFETAFWQVFGGFQQASR
jgi:hypothetical protein